MVLRGCKLQFSASLQVDKNLYTGVSMYVCVRSFTVRDRQGLCHLHGPPAWLSAVSLSSPGHVQRLCQVPHQSTWWLSHLPQGHHRDHSCLSLVNRTSSSRYLHIIIIIIIIIIFFFYYHYYLHCSLLCLHSVLCVVVVFHPSHVQISVMYRVQHKVTIEKVKFCKTD